MTNTELAQKAIALLTNSKPPSRELDEKGPIEMATATDVHDSILAVKIGSPVVGDFWLCLSDTEPFDPGDGFAVYRPAEIRALSGKGYGPHDLAAVHRAKQALEGTIIR